MTAPVTIPVPIRLGQAAYILGVDRQTVRRYADAGRLTRGDRGLYDSAEVHALAGKLRAEREQRHERAQAAKRERNQQRRQRERAAAGDS